MAGFVPRLALDAFGAVSEGVPRVGADEARGAEGGAFTARFVRRAVPAVVSDVQRGWAAEGRWTVERLAERFGGVVVGVHLPDGSWAREPLAEYAAKANERAEEAERSGGAPPYIRTWTFEDELPELASEWERPDDIFEDWFMKLPEAMRPPFTFMFVGTPGAETKLHVDIWNTDAWLTNLQGAKRFVLFHPAQRRLVEDEDGFVDLRDPDAARFPELKKATPVVVDLAEGETIYIPRKWPHYAVSLTPTVSLTVNFCSAANRRAVLELAAAYADRRAACEELLGRPLKSTDNLMKFCCQGGKVQLASAAAVMGRSVADLARMVTAKEDAREDAEEEAGGGPCASAAEA